MSGSTSLRRKKALFALLYFAEGGPIGLIWWALPTWLRSDGLTPASIAAIGAAVTWPWTLKVFLAPLVDLLRGPRFGLRAWLVVAQLGMALTLVPLLIGGFDRTVGSLVALLVLHAFCAATQDVTIDALAVQSVPREHLGAIHGWMQVGMLGGRGLFGGGAILGAQHFGKTAVMSTLLVSIIVPTVVLCLWGLPADFNSRRPPHRRVWLARLGRMARSRTFWLGFALAALAGAGFEAMTGLAGPFLLDRGADESLIGQLFLVPTIAAMGVGALLGGRLSDRHGRARAVLIGEAAAAVFVIGVALVDLLGPPTGWLPAAVTLLLCTYCALGMATSALYALLMDLTSPRLAATQFAAFMGAINLCYVWSSGASSWMLARTGYGETFAALAGVSLLSLVLLRPLAASQRRTASRTPRVKA